MRTVSLCDTEGGEGHISLGGSREAWLSLDPRAASLTWCAADMEFLEVLTEGLERVLLVRGGGREVITIYS